MSYEPLKPTAIAPGWLEVDIPGVDDSVRVLVAWEIEDGRAVVRSLVLHGDLDAATMRSVSRARIEAGLNHPQWGPLGGGGKQATADEWGDALAPEVRAFTEGLEAYLAKPRKASRRPRKAPARKPLTRPDGRDPETFYRQVAAAYAEAGSRPAPVIAAEAGVPVPTARGWIAEARRRGFLAPARRGSAG